jgi:hypothetical protein
MFLEKGIDLSSSVSKLKGLTMMLKKFLKVT